MMGNVVKTTETPVVSVKPVYTEVNLDTIPEAFELEISKDIDYNYYIQELAKKLKVDYIDLFSIIAIS